MPGFVDAIARFLGGIGAENLGTVAVFVSLTVWAFLNGLRKASRPQPDAAIEPVSKRLDRIETEQAHKDERQALSDARIARVEGQVEVLQTLIVGKSDN